MVVKKYVSQRNRIKVRKKRKIVIISINNTEKPRTGGEYVYFIIKKTLENEGHSIENYSLPNILDNYKNKIVRTLITPIFFIWLVILSILSRLSDNIVITSGSPAFPLFGDIIYHQPKSSIKTGDTEGLSLYERIAMLIHEYEWFSPIWLIAKKTYKLHISNSRFTKHLVKEIYNLDSIVVYPPVNVAQYLDIDIENEREFSILVSRPRVISGIRKLKDIITRLPKDTRFTLFGDIDETGKDLVNELCDQGYALNYLGYVDEQSKKQLFSEHSHYLHFSVNEPFGITVIEAMASGCVPVAHNSGGVPEYLPSNYLYTDSFEAVTILLNNELRDINLRKLNRTIARKFDLSIFQKKILHFVKELQTKKK